MTKTKTLTAITFSLILITAAFMAITPTAQAQHTNMQEAGSVPLPTGVIADNNIDTISHLSFRPNPVGVSQPMIANMWVQPNLWGGRQYTDYKVTFTRPDGTTESLTVNGYMGDSTSWLEYTPDMVGTWKIQFDFPGGYFPAGNYTTVWGVWIGPDVVQSFPESVYYKPSSDGPYEFVVQIDPVLSWPESPLPTDYWTRPVSPENREWHPILGSYPATGVVGYGSDWPTDTNIYMSNYDYIPYTQAPNTAHVVWRRQGNIAGLYGGVFGSTLSRSSGGGGPSIVYAGRAYQSITKVVDGEPTSVWQSYDLRTGEVYWERTGVSAPNMVIYNWGWTGGEAGLHGSSGARSGVELARITGGKFITYNPFTGAETQSISISPLTSGTFYATLDYAYFLSIQNIGTSQSPDYRLINWTIGGDPGRSNSIINVRMMVKSNVTWPFSSLGTVDYEAGIAVSVEAPRTNPATQTNMEARIMGVDIETGQLQWNITKDIGVFSASTSVADQGKFALRFNDGKWHCFDLKDGKELWTGETSSWPWGTLGAYGVHSYGGMIISLQYDGIAAYDWTTGKVVWFYQSKTPYAYETPYQDNFPFFTGTSRIADGKLYTYNTEHTPTQPLTRGWRLHCIDITTGEGIWNITGSMSPGAIADGYLTTSNGYDGYMYVFGKGQSATTVSAPQAALPKDSNVMITGSVLDMSPGNPNTPAVADESMSAWMEYLYMQKPIPGDAKGVTVKLGAIDSNGNYQDIGEATSDLGGNFGKSWMPPVEGDYTIMATFEGTESYGSSFDTTYFTVDPAPEPTPTQTPATQTDTYITGSTIAILAGIAIAVFLILRKK